MRILYLLLFLFSFSIASAQKVDLANPEKSFQRILFSKVIGQNEGGFFVLRSSSAFHQKTEQLRIKDNRLEISYVQNNLSMKWTYPVQLPANDPEIQDIAFVADSLYIFYAAINKEKNTNELFAVKVNVARGGLSGEPKLLDEIQFDKKRNRGVFYLKRSKNGKLLCSVYKQNNPDDEKLNISIKVLDSSFTALWERKYKTDYYDGVLLLNDMKMSNDSTVYILTSFDLDKKLLRDRKFTIIVAEKEIEKLVLIPVSMEKYFVSDIKMELDYLNNQIVLAGFYSEMNSFSSAGIFYANLPFGERVVKIRSESFKAKFLNEFNSERTVNRGTELINYFVDKIILRTDGGVILIAESNYITESTNYNSYYQLYTTSYTYHYDNILLFSINPDGKIHWESIIRKNQTSEDDAAFYSSYIISMDADRIHLLYNKSIRKSTDIVSCTIDNKGSVYEKIFVKENNNLLMMPGGGKQISSDQLIIPCLQKNKANFMRVTF